MQVPWHRFKSTATSLIRLITDWALFIVIVLAGGYGTSWYMVEAGTSLTTQRSGPWVAWTAQARVDADPYTRAHFARRGTLDLNADTATTYVARTDQTGAALDASCVYEVTGEQLDADWWSLTLYDSDGRLIPNAANRYGFTRDTVVISANGRFTISLSRNAHEGNWIPFGNASNFALVLYLLQPDISLLEETDDTEQTGLPEIKKVVCR